MGEITNDDMCVCERMWLEAMLNGCTTADADVIAEQVNSASMRRECDTDFHALVFDVPDGAPLLPPYGHEPVLLDMLARVGGSRFPVDFLLHVRGGRVTELEAYNVAGESFDRGAPVLERVVRDWTDPRTRDGARELPSG